MATIRIQNIYFNMYYVDHLELKLLPKFKTTAINKKKETVICWSHLTLLLLPHFYSWTKGQLISGQYQTKLKIHTNKMMLLYESWAKITEGFWRNLKITLKSALLSLTILWYEYIHTSWLIYNDFAFKWHLYAQAFIW